MIFGKLLAIPFIFVFLLLVLWSLFIFHHLRTYVIRGDKMNATMTTVFLAGSIAFIVLCLALFLQTPWSDITISLPGLNEGSSRLLR